MTITIIWNNLINKINNNILISIDQNSSHKQENFIIPFYNWNQNKFLKMKMDITDNILIILLMFKKKNN